MGLFSGVFSPIAKQLEKLGYNSELGRFRSALKNNPNDHDLRAQLVKHCLRHVFTHPASAQAHRAEAITHFDTIVHSDVFDPELFYLMGKFYQGEDIHKAADMYLDGVRRFNRFIEKNPSLKNDYMEIALTIALNLLTLRPGQMDPELGKFFRIIRKSFPFHVKWVELESEIEKPQPDSERVQQLTREIEQLKATRDMELLKTRQVSKV